MSETRDGESSSSALRLASLPFRFGIVRVVALGLLFLVLNAVSYVVFEPWRTTGLQVEAEHYIERSLLLWEESREHGAFGNFMVGTAPQKLFVDTVCLGGRHAARQLKSESLEQLQSIAAVELGRPELAAAPPDRMSMDSTHYYYHPKFAQPLWRRAFLGGLFASGILLLAAVFFIQWLVPRLRAGPAGGPSGLGWRAAFGVYFLAAVLGQGMLLIVDGVFAAGGVIAPAWYAVFSLILFQVLPCLLMVFWLSGTWRAAAAQYRFRPADFAAVRHWRWAGLVFMLFWFAGWLIFLGGILTGHLNLLDAFLHGNSGMGAVPIVLTLVGGVVCAPLFEEIIFRGYLLDGLESKLGFWPSAVLGSALFSAIHFYSELGTIDIFLFGLLQCVVVRKTGSLAPAMIGHVLINASIFVPAGLMFWPL